MNTITIDSGIYQFAANYAAKRNVSVRRIVEDFILSLREQNDNEIMENCDSDPNVLPFDKLHPELRKILKLSESLKGTMPEWDLNGDKVRDEILNNR